MIYHHFRQFITLARLTALEAIRQPLTFLLFTASLALIALLPLVLSHTLGESAKFVRDGSLAFMMLTGLILGAHLACASLHTEIRRGTVAAVLSKPVQRTVFFLAKFTGIALIMTVFSVGLLMAIMLSVRAVHEPFFTDWHAAGPLWLALLLSFSLGGVINFIFRRPFVSNAFWVLFILLTAAFLYGALINPEGEPAAFGHLYDFRIFRAGFLIVLAILILTAMSVSLASRFSTVPTLSFCGAIFIMGLLSDYFLGGPSESYLWAKALYYAVPNWQHFWVVDALAGDGLIPGVYLRMATSYAALYLSAILLAGLVAFQGKEVEG